MTTWKPDTCDCIVEYRDADTRQLIAVRRKCGFHAAIPDNLILSTVRAHNRSFNLAVGTEEEISAAKAAELKRIRAL